MNKQLVSPLVLILAILTLGCANAMAHAPSFMPQQRPSAPVVYTCPMHAEVKSKKRGKCPKCKMDLVRQTTSAAVAASQPSEEVVSESGKGLNIPDVEVLDQDGNTRHFYSDLIKGKIVAVNFIFTNCTTICPPLGATFARVQRELGSKVGKDVYFISVSVDPLTDTPERLKAWGAKFKAGPGWTFITGNKEEIDRLLRALGASAARREDHTPSVIIGNDRKDIWTRTYGLASASQMVGLIDDVMGGSYESKN
jgi:cytochrome oxidase Cu insertion factor (SCO1/SenC/PrrC family)